MSKICTACGYSETMPEAPLPPGATESDLPEDQMTDCPNCGKEGSMEEVPDESDEDEE